MAHQIAQHFEEILEIMSVNPLKESPLCQGFTKCPYRFFGHHDLPYLEDFLYKITIFKYEHQIPDERAIGDLEMLFDGIAQHWWTSLERTPNTWTEAVCLTRRTFRTNHAGKADLDADLRTDYIEEILEAMSLVEPSSNACWSKGFANCVYSFSGQHDLFGLEDFLYDVTCYKFNHNISDARAIKDVDRLLDGIAKLWWRNIDDKPETWTETVCLIRRTFQPRRWENY